jgi:hypothetical protein
MELQHTFLGGIMTDRIHSLTVVLEEDVREDDVQSLMQAICHMRNVAAVDGVVSDIVSHMAETRAKLELGAKARLALEQLISGKEIDA